MSDKAEVRKSLLAQRKIHHAQAPEKAAAALADYAAEINAKPALNIAAYLPMGSEIDPRPLMVALAAAGHNLCLPYCKAEPQPMQFRAYKIGDALAPDGCAIDAPVAEKIIMPDIILLPLLGFDLKGNRLGRGAGYYDMTLNALREAGEVQAIGVAYAAQMLDICPIEPHDEALDAVLSERGLTRFERIR